MSLSRIALVAVVLSALAAPSIQAAPAQPAAASTPHPAKPPFPLLNLPESNARGQRAIDLLGDRLPEVAAWHRMSADELRSRLLEDRRLRIDRRGRLFVEDELDAPLPAGAASATTTSVQDGSLQPLDQTFMLHSRPGAKRTIHLNFKGAVLSNTAWSGAGTITALPFDTDGVPYAFSAGELERIQTIWQRVAEDFAPFDVDVTTEQPAADLLTRSSSSDQVFGTTVLVTHNAGVYSCSCGGVAYIGAFDDTSDYYKPALVFYNMLGNGNEKFVAEAISHEAGHNMGLLHDGTATAGYYTGHGSGATGWAPIMGVGYYQPLVQWSKGEYAGANQAQDDYVVMQANGLPLRIDDHGNTIGSATALTATVVNGATLRVAEGVIERPADVDVFSFTSGAGVVGVDVNPAARSPNVDLKIELLDAAGALLASANPVDALPASMSVTVPSAGTYYVTVRGTGKGDPLTTGYSAYGSVGVYAVSVAAPSAGSLPPVAAAGATPASGTVPLTVAFSSAGSTDPDGSIVAFEWNFGDGSAAASGPGASHTYTAAGSYLAELRVTDNSGLTASKSVAIEVAPVVAVLPMRVADIAMSLAGNNRNARAVARVLVRDGDGRNGDGRAVAGATVQVAWSGLVGGSASAVTDASGVATLQSPSTRSRGTFIVTVTGVSAPGHAYTPALNAETSDSITR